LVLVVAIADEDELAMLIELPDLVLLEIVNPQLFGNQVHVRSIDTMKVDEERDRTA
jgi:hypothetical protein